MIKLTRKQYADLNTKFKASKDAWQVFHYAMHSAGIDVHNQNIRSRHMIIEDEMDYLGLYVAEHKPDA